MSNLLKSEVLELVEESGKLYFIGWCKYIFKYSNEKFTVSGQADYRDDLCYEETIQDLVELDHLSVYCKETGEFIYSE